MDLQTLFSENSLAVTKEQLNKLYAYESFLLDRNKTLNLISRQETEDFALRHILDSARPVPLFPEENEKGKIGDLGSGGGLPGIVIAILLPERQITLIESKEKKNKFLQSCISHLNLKNVEVLNPSRDKPESNCSLLISRAFGTLGHIWKEGKRYLSSEGIIAAYKGRESICRKEMKNLPARVDATIIPYTLEGPTDRQLKRHLVLLQKRST